MGDSSQDFSDELLIFMTELAEEGERAVVIGGAARVEVALEHLLKSVLHHNPTGTDELFDTDRALGTFSAKINLGYRLGLLDDEMKKALNIIRRIRNQFAHATTHARLSQPEHADRVNELQTCAEKNPTRMAKTREESWNLFGTRLAASFCLSLWLVTMLLEKSARANTPLTPEKVAAL
jgi:DNA-binding MltR family transcriptional regulator